MSVGYQSFYQAQLTAGISDTDLTIPLDVAPSPSEGFLVIESTVSDKREIIYYTSKTPTSVTCPADGRGYDGTTATTHQQNAVVIMAPVGAMFSELREQFTTTPQGWTSVVPTITDVTYNGNRSYTLTHDASVAAVISEGMRRRFTRTVAANTYMGGLMNGSSHYFTKTTPSGTLGTVTNNFTIMAWVEPTAYQASFMCGRSDATPANGLWLEMNSSGQIICGVRNGAAGNYRYVNTYQSLPLNKKTHIAASWTGGTVVIYFDGVSVPVQAAVTGGTAPTTAGTGGDFSIGRMGAYAVGYFPGYISNVAVFDAVLSAATIRQHATYKLTGSETNCIGAWSLDNTANDQSSAANNLTATGGVGFSNVSPFGNNGKSSTLEYGLTMSVSSDGLTEVVQVPEGCALPTTGGITSQDYSTQGNPFGWVSDKGRWKIQTFNTTAATSTTSTTYVSLTDTIIIPIGGWILSGQILLRLDQPSGTGFVTAQAAISSSVSSVSDNELLAGVALTSATSGSARNAYTASVNKAINMTVATTYTLIGKVSSGSTLIIDAQNVAPTIITALPSGL